MPAYLMLRAVVHDPKAYKEYTRRTPEIIARFGGKFIVRGGQTVTLEGPPEARRVVVVEFPSLEQAQAFYNSAEYQAALPYRLKAADAELILVDGV